ncbi:MAG: translation initiation factor IF-2 N-terminal domain-containing protein, partial [Syntrophaceae bacterium]|nr:translation initiation factor IF-2 N-terminal domain-containing protein [Syntrophaceae bacterium]
MTKKRVYELAKEMGLENKELIARLEKIGIAVRSHSSTLEDADLERIQDELLSPEPREVVEQRIKSTVIRRRAVRTPAEESRPEDLAEATPTEELPAAALPTPSGPVKTAPPAPPEPKEAPVRTSIYRGGQPGAAKIVVPPPPQSAAGKSE